ncbi:beta-L-arabinofuranosidase domain-containing protein [Streptomyces sp. NPDC005538]|uniref:beta-L-arabinofuranosidase domain-containing protein n=1 Tax=unclassified Streptomyces TaxID=2593676 RepID=UPI0033B69BE2
MRPEAHSTPLSRRRLFQAGAVALAASVIGPVLGTRPALAATLPQAHADGGVTAQPFDLGQVQLAAGRWLDNMNRTLAYLQFIDTDRLLYNFRANHGLSTQGAVQCYGWEAPTFEFRTHSQGHFLSAWAQAYAVTGDTQYRDKATYMVAELAKCQANDATAGFNTGYLSGFPESDLDTVETGVRKGVPYYCIHKTMAGLLDVWRLTGNTQARDVLLNKASWVDWRTARLSYTQMQTTLTIEFGGMNAVLTDLYQMTGDTRWLTVAQRFDHAAVFDPLASDTDALSGLHANTQVPKMVGSAREFEATGTTRYRDIARNFWTIVLQHHTYAFGGNSVLEFFKAPDAIAAYLTADTCESCNTYNMLKLTRELFRMDPGNAAYFDYYERALTNQLLGQQDPTSAHGFICYFTPSIPGGQRTYSNDYNTFTCCQNTGMETQTKLTDSIYFRSDADDVLYVNLFIGSTLTWSTRGVTVTQTTTFPASDTSTLKVTGTSGTWAMKIRIPSWTSNAQIQVNGTTQSLTLTPGTYATLSRAWADGDTVTVKLPMSVTLPATNDDPGVKAITYGPVVLSGTYGTDALHSTLPVLKTSSIQATSTPLNFTATANGSTVNLIPFYDNHHQNYSIYWDADGKAAAPPRFLLVNQNSGKCAGVQSMSRNDGGLAVQFADNGSPDHNWELVLDGSYVRLRNQNSGKVLGVDGASSADGAKVLQWTDNGTADHKWQVVDLGTGYVQFKNANSAKLLGVTSASTADGAQLIQWTDTGTTDHNWRIVPLGYRRLKNVNSGLLLGVKTMSTADGGLAIQWDDNGTADHLWQFVDQGTGYFKIKNLNSQKILGVSSMSTAAGATVLQWSDSGTDDHLWRLRYATGNAFVIQNKNSALVLGVDQASTTLGAQVVQSTDDGSTAHLWQIV